MTDTDNEITDNNDDIMKDFNLDDGAMADSDLDADVDLSAILEDPSKEINNEDVVPNSEVVMTDDLLYGDDPQVGEEVVASADVANDDELMGEPSANLPFLKWYDNTKNYKAYEIAKNFTSGSFAGSEDCDTIHINVGFDTYGWLVVFADGITMSLHDVKEYQLRQGCLPFASGRITYGSSVLDFDKVKRIVVYETVKYFSYGA